jgi:hypothetical protein
MKKLLQYLQDDFDNLTYLDFALPLLAGAIVIIVFAPFLK